MSDKELTEEEEKPEEEVKEDKDVEESTFNKYRDAYLREQLQLLNVKENEVDASLKFIDDRADETDSNLDEVMYDLRVRMRLDERKSYINQSFMEAGRSGRPKAVNGEKIGREAVQNLLKKGRVL